jgi:hypothetical protein
VTAIPLVAGKGVRLTADTVNNRWIVEADETVLWEGTVPSTSGSNLNYTIPLSEAITNFEIIRVFLYDTAQAFGLFELNPLSPKKKEMLNDGTGRNVIMSYYAHCDDSTHLTYQCGFGNNTWNTPYTGEYYGYGKPYKVVGINRIASN